MTVGAISIPFKLLFRLFLLLMMMLISYSTYLVYELYQLTQELRELESSRYHMVTKANELRRSSEDLTRFARLYVVTADPQYLTHYDTVLGIRNGTLAKPAFYDAIYWDLMPPLREERHPSTFEKQSLSASLDRLPFSPKERQLLAESELQSNHLVALERQAFKAMQGEFLNEAGEYVITGRPDPALASQLLHSTAYDEAKQRIMLPIDQFLINLGQRLNQEIGLQEREQTQLIASLPLMLSLNVFILFVSFKSISSRMDAHHKALAESSLKDYLTGINNRKYAMDFGPKLLSLNQRQNQNIAVILMDVDHFKGINDEYGHGVGDQVLKHLSKAISERTRKADIFARYGGEEFIFILSNTHSQGALNYAEDLRRSIARNHCLCEIGAIEYTVSMGLAISDETSTLEGLISQADHALYESKRSGRNRVTRYQLDGIKAYNTASQEDIPVCAELPRLS